MANTCEDNETEHMNLCMKINDILKESWGYIDFGATLHSFEYGKNLQVYY